VPRKEGVAVGVLLESWKHLTLDSTHMKEALDIRLYSHDCLKRRAARAHSVTFPFTRMVTHTYTHIHTYTHTHTHAHTHTHT